MTRDDVIRWACEVGLPVSDTFGPMVGACPVGDVLERFAAKVAADAAAKERAAILRAIDELEEPPYTGYENPNMFDDGCIAVADAIRARSTP